MIRSFRTEIVLILAAILFASVPASSDDVVSHLAAWNDRENSHGYFNILGMPTEMLPGGINNLAFLILGDSLNDGSSLAVIGYGQNTQSFGTVEFEMFLNPSKVYASFSSIDSLIILTSEYPARATRCNMSFYWNVQDNTLVPVDSWITDRSADLLAAADTLLDTGEIRPAADSIHAMLYGWAYYDTSELCCRFLRAAHQASLDAPDEEALNFYDDMVYAFDIIQYDDTWFISFSTLDDFMRSDYAEFIEAEELADILHDFAKLFRENDYVVEAIFDSTADILEGKTE